MLGRQIYVVKLYPEKNLLLPDGKPTSFSDTIFGWLCHAILSYYNLETLKKILKDFNETSIIDPPFLISSGFAFSNQTLFFPIILSKKLGTFEYISQGIFTHICKEGKWPEREEIDFSNCQKFAYLRIENIKEIVRYRDLSSKPKGDIAAKLLPFTENSGIYFFLAPKEYELDKFLFAAICEFSKTNGFGGGLNLGIGKIKNCTIEPIKFDFPKSSLSFIILSRAAKESCSGWPEKGVFETVISRGWAYHGKNKLPKKTTEMFIEGSVFAGSIDKLIFQGLVNVTPDNFHGDHRVDRYSYPFCIPCNIHI